MRGDRTDPARWFGPPLWALHSTLRDREPRLTIDYRCSLGQPALPRPPASVLLCIRNDPLEAGFNSSLLIRSRMQTHHEVHIGPWWGLIFGLGPRMSMVVRSR